MTTRPRSFITSVDVRPSNGGHEYVSVFIRGQNVGTLCVGKGDGEVLAYLLGYPQPHEELPTILAAPLGDAEHPLVLQGRPLPFALQGPLHGAPRLRPPGPWSTHEPTMPGVEQCERSFLPADGGHSPLYRDGVGACGYCGKVPTGIATATRDEALGA